MLQSLGQNSEDAQASVGAIGAVEAQGKIGRYLCRAVSEGREGCDRSYRATMLT